MSTIQRSIEILHTKAKQAAYASITNRDRTAEATKHLTEARAREEALKELQEIAANTPDSAEFQQEALTCAQKHKESAGSSALLAIDPSYTASAREAFYAEALGAQLLAEAFSLAAELAERGESQLRNGQGLKHPTSAS